MGRYSAGQRRSSGLMWGITLVLAGGLTWASLAEIDQVTRAEARVIASSRTQVIQSPDGGVIAELLVREGDVVKPGQVLARLDATKTQAAFQEFNAKSAALRAQVSRLRAEMLPLNPNLMPTSSPSSQDLSRTSSPFIDVVTPRWSKKWQAMKRASLW